MFLITLIEVNVVHTGSRIRRHGVLVVGPFNQLYFNVCDNVLIKFLRPLMGSIQKEMQGISRRVALRIVGRRIAISLWYIQVSNIQVYFSYYILFM